VPRVRPLIVTPLEHRFDLQIRSTHPIAMPQGHLFYETLRATEKFNDRWEETDGWPFVWSTGYVL